MNSVTIQRFVKLLLLNFQKVTAFMFFLSPLQDIFKQATEDRLTSANELPYFEGDFWPNVLEESIKELEQEEEERKKEENTAASETPEVCIMSPVSTKLYVYHCWQLLFLRELFQFGHNEYVMCFL